MSQGKDGREKEVGMEAAEPETGEELPERWSARAKAEIVLRLFDRGRLARRSRCRQFGTVDRRSRSGACPFRHDPEHGRPAHGLAVAYAIGHVETPKGP